MQLVITFLRDTLERKELYTLILLSFLCRLAIMTPTVAAVILYQAGVDFSSTSDAQSLLLLTITAIIVTGYFDWKKNDILRKKSIDFERDSSSQLLSNPRPDVTLNENAKNQKATIERTERLKTYLSSGKLLPIIDLLWTPILIAILFSVQPWLGFISCTAIIAMYSAHFIFRALTSQELNQLAKEKMASTLALQSFCVNQGLSHSMGQQKTVREKWLENHLKLIRRDNECFDLGSYYHLFVCFLYRFSLAVSIISSISFVMPTHTPFGLALLSPFLIFLILRPFKSALLNNHELIAISFDSKEAGKAAPTPLEPPPAIVPKPFCSQIKGPAVEFTNVSIGQNTATPVISDANLTLESGKIHIFSGPQSSGKTSLCEAILGIQDCHLGNVRIAGLKASSIDNVTRKKLLGYCPQKPQLFRGSVADNISLFSKSSIADIIRTAKQTGIHSDILRLPQNYNTQIDDDCKLLSNTLKYQISLARALHNAPSLLIFDDPQQSTIAFSNAIFLRLIRKLKAQGKTIIITSNNDVFEPYADHSYTLIDGRIQELNLNILSSSVPSRFQPSRSQPSNCRLSNHQYLGQTF